MPTKLKVALITCSDMGDFSNNVESEDDQVIRFFNEQGLDIKFEVWNDPAVEWKDFDALLLKTPWDYFDLPEKFDEWLQKIEDAGIPIFNSVNTIRWNADKIYLQDVHDAGFNIVPTLWLNKNSSFEAEALYEEVRSERLIIKPRISGGSKHTYAIKREESAAWKNKIDGLLQQEDYMVQPFISEIESKGEWSLLFFNGQFSHSVLKTAKPGDFRVQHYLGGTIHAIEAPDSIKSCAQEIVDAFAADSLYARVDGIEIDGQLMLMELELIEPFLFLFTHPDAMRNYYNAFMKKMQEMQVA